MPSEAAFLSLKIVYSSREFEPLIRLEVPSFESTILLKIKQILVPGRGLEPPRCYPLVPETSASTNSATRAGEEGRAMYARGRRLSIEGA
jgi:hypothetical protein